MQLHWYGHSAFRLTTENGTRLLIDPYNRFLGYRMPSAIETDIVLVTHSHKDHNQIQVAAGQYLLCNQPLTYEKNDVKIRGVRTFHDNQGGAKRGPNIVFVIEADGLRIAHCGDLGHQLTPEQLAEIGQVDILIVPAGGRMVLGGQGAADVVRQIKPTIAIPMHYRAKALGLLGKLVFEKADNFVAASGLPSRTAKELDVTRETIGEYAGVVLMQYA